MSQGFSKSSIGRKVLMALSGFFLLVFLFQHFVINFLSVISKDAFNDVSFFMGTNPFIQYLMQPVLLFGVLFHLITGITMELKNKAARPIKYAVNSANANSSWMSRNMAITGMMIMLFLGLHFYDFWIPEIKTKFIEGDMTGLNANGELRFYEELLHKFTDPIRVGIYVLAFVFLSLHLMHGFQSAFQSVGFNHRKYTPTIKKLGQLYAIIIPLGFIFIAIYHHFVNAH
ncbi:MAG: succinate dehydrogenase cytochrome b subunit [Flavobacteriales bacterium]|nr:MAG: succinate dehydrogenase cytochrome b subunit [Flavobacteriales bacterium]MBX2960708.1 succinate dehydrogenase cytochrome b subunit [Flavobacteriales bacterium]